MNFQDIRRGTVTPCRRVAAKNANGCCSDPAQSSNAVQPRFTETGLESHRDKEGSSDQRRPLDRGISQPSSPRVRQSLKAQHAQRQPELDLVKTGL